MLAAKKLRHQNNPSTLLTSGARRRSGTLPAGTLFFTPHPETPPGGFSEPAPEPGLPKPRCPGVLFLPFTKGGTGRASRYHPLATRPVGRAAWDAVVRIGIDVTPLLRRRTGIAVCTELVLDLVKAAGHEPIGLASGYRTLDGKVPDLGLPVRRNWVPWLADRLFSDLLGRPAVEDLVGRVDAYIATNHVVFPARRARNIALVHDVGRLTHPHLYGRRQVWRFRHLARRLARLSDLFVVPTEAIAQEMLGLGIGTRDRIRVVPWFARVLPANGAAMPSGVPEDLPLILCVATLERRKNVPHLVRAFQRAAHAVPHHLVVAGGAGPSLEEALSVARSNGAADRIHFIGHARADQLGALYRKADLAVCPSLYEGFGLPLVEAMAHGCPVMASDIPVHREVGGGAIRLVPADDEDALVDGLVDLSRDQGARLALRRLGLERARDFSQDRTRQLLGALFSWRSAP